MESKGAWGEKSSLRRQCQRLGASRAETPASQSPMSHLCLGMQISYPCLILAIGCKPLCIMSVVQDWNVPEFCFFLPHYHMQTHAKKGPGTQFARPQSWTVSFPYTLEVLWHSCCRSGLVSFYQQTMSICPSAHQVAELGSRHIFVS